MTMATPRRSVLRMQPLLGSKTAGISLLDGIDARKRFGAIVGSEPVVGVWWRSRRTCVHLGSDRSRRADLRSV